MWDGPAAETVERLWWTLLMLGTAVYLLVLALLLAAVRHRHADDDDGDHPPDVPHRTANRWIVAGGVVLPGLMLPATLAASVLALRELPRSAGPDGLIVDVVGHQWWWEGRYPNGVTVANEIHIPAGEPVELRLTSSDVIHSFWVPDLAGKVDALPDRTTTLVLEADRPGEYRGVCAEFCGLQHARMNVLVVAEPPDRFSEWLAQQGAQAAEATTDEERRGQRVFLGQRCGSCHTVRGLTTAEEEGPELTHFASRRTLTAASLTDTSESLARWLRDPGMVKEGTAMPAVRLDGEELDALLAYLESLE